MQLVGSLVALLVGLGLGFVINLVATRLGRGRPLIGPLRCARSPHALKAQQALPLVGYLLQRGKCSTCGERLLPSFPLVEGTMAVLLVVLFLLEGWSLSFLFHTAYSAILMLVLVIDWKHKDIYLSVIGLGSLLALVGSLLLPNADLVNALVGAGVAGGFFLVAYVLARVIFPHVQEPLGLGDVFLALMMGLMLGFPNVVGALLIGPLLAGAAVIGLLVSRRSKFGDFMPYGVALCLAAILFLVYPAPFADALRLPALKNFVFGLFGQS